MSDIYNQLSSAMANIMGMEAIDFQVNNGLGKELEKIFQDVLQFKANLDYSNVNDTPTARREYRINQIVKYVTDTTGPKMSKIISKYTGIAVRQVVVIGSPDYPPLGFFAFSGHSKHDESVAIGAARSTGDNSPYSTNEKYQADLDEMSKMADQMDLSKAKYMGKFTEEEKRYYSKFYFDATYAFCLEDYYPMRTGEDLTLTARELTAIILHEIGHAFTILEHMNNLYYQSDRMTRIKMHVNKDNVHDVIKSMHKELVPVLKEIPKKFNAMDGKEHAAIRRLTNTLMAGIETLNTASDKILNEDADDASYIFATLETFATVICIPVIALMSIAYNLCMVVFMIHLFYEGYKYSYNDNGKTSDTTSNRTNLRTLERWADEFATRMGYGDALASSLRKLVAVDKLSSLGDISSAKLRNSTIFAGIADIMGTFIDKVYFMSYFEPIIYDNNYDRLKRICITTRTIFKNADIPSAVGDVWLQSLTSAMADAERVKTLSDTEFAKGLYNLLISLTNPVAWYQALKDGKLERDYARLYDRLYEIENNPLYSQAYRLQRR